MIGNDIVSLTSIGSPHPISDPSFYKRVLHTTELAWYKAATPEVPFEQFLWLIWSMKEAAYKSVKRTWPNLSFLPLQYELKELTLPHTYSAPTFNNAIWQCTGCPSTFFFPGILNFESTTIYTRSLIHPFFIATVASVSDVFTAMLHGFHKISSPDHHQQSHIVRKLAVERLQLVRPAPTYRVEKSSAGFPLIVENDRITTILASFAHHGYYVFYTLLL